VRPCLARLSSDGAQAPHNIDLQWPTLRSVRRPRPLRAARSDKRDSEVVEDALRAYLGFTVVERIWARSKLSEEEAMRLAVTETHAVRRGRRAARGS